MAPALSPAALAAAEAAEAQISADVSEDNVGSISLGIVAPGGHLIRHRAFGWARKGFGGAEWLPNRGPGFIYRIGSISKSVTVVGLMSLVEEGILALTDLASAPHLLPRSEAARGSDEAKGRRLLWAVANGAGSGSLAEARECRPTSCTPRRSTGGWPS